MSAKNEAFWLETGELLRDDEVGEIVTVTRRLADVDDSGPHARIYTVADWTLTHYENVTEEEARNRYERTGRDYGRMKPSQDPWVRQQMADYGHIDQEDV